MNSYIKQVELSAPIEEVYEAITTEKGIKSWWTVDCDVSTEVGGVHSFRFERLLFNSMKIVDLVPSEKVHWTCIEGWNEWKGTDVVFKLRSIDERKTSVEFQHIGLTPSLSCYKMCSKGWDDTLLHLQQYVENGETNAHVPHTGLKGVLSRSAFKVFTRQYTK
ncbi:SRPBCC domain-containing protein [Paenisporosarcina sp. OV554]|uniref:SRPBCC family protein n=1 Tax=Paenisporosarcina sp. OV554 TaxID=2135694 RepID=UPI000D381F4A|nr:SRPBCC domain-containing protein [Paenisporosarcina sp. OV554]PUB16726.1 uncharacterized protein YndB with AHSA1/START domain [Paenisporosarcina sp. OV554]